MITMKYWYTNKQNVLGTGTFGTVRKGISKLSSNVVAIKVIDKVANQKILWSIKNEVRILKFCTHPNIVCMIDSFESFDSIFIIMEYMKGGDLFTYLRNCKHGIPESLSTSIIFQITTAIDYMHQCGVIHRDLKLENILIKSLSEKSIVVKVSDFGLSALTSPSQDSKEKLGTLHYVAPEILESKVYDNSVDVWSLGVIMYALLSGSFPFDDANESLLVKYIALIRKIINPQLKLKGGVWVNISDNAIDLLKSM